MEIHVVKNSKIKHISVSGNLFSNEAKHHLLKILSECDNLEIQITFLDANVLPYDIVEKLVLIQQNGKNRVYVLQRYLYSYLYNLGIDCIYVKDKSINSDDTFTASSPDMPDKQQIIDFLNELYKKYGYDYTQYQLESIIRRINITMLRENAKNFGKFKAEVLENKHIFKQLFLDFSINTTEFFRDPEVFSEIREKLLPCLNALPHIKIWCAGCSTGQEPYSMAIMLEELGMLHKTQIYSTDINPFVIEEAKNGLFPIWDVEIGKKNYISSGGEKNFTDYFKLYNSYIKINDNLKEKILFFPHNLVNNGELQGLDMILCRNVLIYFNPGLQKKVLKIFSESLNKDGFLVLGKSEGILTNNGYLHFNSINENNKIYRK